ncbi:hypothetical protein PR048_023312 [Dryococelus australis]|uniref:Uncharacterized protein n=1 Tax=Dryococelus australis TaxID=614101 RepID=A0ABQ9GTQ6_9NEOP|nr:hypothetical protein PR048_023312 [Dryococelus australis]
MSTGWIQRLSKTTLSQMLKDAGEEVKDDESFEQLLVNACEAVKKGAKVGLETKDHAVLRMRMQLIERYQQAGHKMHLRLILSSRNINRMTLSVQKSKNKFLPKLKNFMS